MTKHYAVYSTGNYVNARHIWLDDKPICGTKIRKIAPILWGKETELSLTESLRKMTYHDCQRCIKKAQKEMA